MLSRDESNADGLIVAQTVEEVFVRQGLVWHLHIGGQVIRTTAEHPFYAWGKGWVPCHELVVGDTLLGEDGRWLTVEDLLDTGVWETVYNLRVADFHTYFVGCDEWGFSVWAHNAECAVVQKSAKKWEIVDKATGDVLSSHTSRNAAENASQARAALDEIAATGRLPMPHADLHGGLPAGRINATNRAEFDAATGGWFDEVMIGDRSYLAGLSNRGWERYTHARSTGEIPAIGDFDQVATFTAKNSGYDRLSVTPWNNRVNDAWILGHIERGADVRVVSSVLTDSLRRTTLGRGSGPLIESVFNRELRLLEQHGYRFEQAAGERLGTGWMRRPS